MLVAILSENSMRKNLEDLKNTAKEEFGDSIFIPIEDLVIKNDKKIRFFIKDKEIENIDALIPYPGKNRKKFITALYAFENTDIYIPFGLRTFMCFDNNAIGISILKNNDIETIDFYQTISKKALKPILKTIEYPKLFVVGKNSFIVKDIENAEEIINSRKAGSSISIRDLKSEKLTGCWMVEGEMVATIEIVNNKAKIINTGTTINNTVKKILETLGSPYGYVILDGEKVVSFSLSPPLQSIKDATGKNVSKPLITHLRNMMVPKEKKGFVPKLLEALRLV